VSPHPAGPVRAVGPMRVVLSAYPSRTAALAAIDAALDRRLIACANLLPVDSRYWWKGRVESASESLVLFKTVPRRVEALLRFLKESHPYEVPEVAELDVARVDPSYLRYLATTLGVVARPMPGSGGARRREAPRGRVARGPGRTRAPHRRRSR
jgi:periplasmic divalent cation tolerance protein